MNGQSDTSVIGAAAARVARLDNRDQKHASNADKPTPTDVTAFHGTHDVQDLLTELPALVADERGARERLRQHVALLRRHRATWAEIGGALSISRQAAWQRFNAPSDEC